MSNEKSKPQKGRTAAEALITGVAIAGALILLNLLAFGSRARVDLTEDRIFSLSNASRNLVATMKERINIKGYFGNVPPEHAEKVTYVDMLLAEYAERSNGKIVYERIDPWDKPELQQELKRDGVDKLRLQSRKDDSFEQVPMYFHVVFSHLDKKEVWMPSPAFALEGLEYDFSTRIKRLGHGKKKVGITQGFGEPAETQLLSAPGADVLPGVKVGLGDLYEVTAVNWKDEPKQIEDVDVLIVNGPTQKVSDAARMTLDRAVMTGKPVLFLVSGMRWQAGGGQQQIPGMPQDPEQPFLGIPGDTGLDELLLAYGFKVGQDVVMDLRYTAVGWLPPGSREGYRARGLFPHARSLQSGEKEILAGIDVVALPFTSTLTLVGPLENPEGDTRVIPLLETAPTSWARKEIVAITPNLALSPPEGEKGPYLVGAAVSGKFPSAFPDVPAPPGADADAAQRKESVSHTRMMVVTAPAIAADTTLMDIRSHGDLVYINGFLALHNLVDWLAEEVDLIAVRAKKPERPIERLAPAERTLVRYANVIGAPLLLIVIGIVTWRLRERRRRNIRL
jgi:ABC-2 type transport system permease protein